MSTRILIGDCRDVLKTLPDASVHCCVTSPPYLGLRDYQMASQIGLESTPEQYVAEMVAVFREVKRVLIDTGTLWLNLGSSYCSKRIESSTYVIRKGLPHEERIAVAQALSSVWAGHASAEQAVQSLLLRRESKTRELPDPFLPQVLGCIPDASNACRSGERDVLLEVMRALGEPDAEAGACCVDVPELPKDGGEVSSPSPQEQEQDGLLQQRLLVRAEPEGSALPLDGRPAGTPEPGIDAMATSGAGAGQVHLPALPLNGAAGGASHPAVRDAQGGTVDCEQRNNPLPAVSSAYATSGSGSSGNPAIHNDGSAIGLQNLVTPKSAIPAAMLPWFEPEFVLKPKDDLMIPHLVFQALMRDGWYGRQDICWSKPNPMPESVTDRCTKSHEYVFMLSKSQRYFFDAKAIAEPCVGQNEHDLTGPGYSAPGQTAQTGTRRLAGNVNPPKGQAAYEAGDERHRTKAGLLNYAVRERSKRDSFKREDSKRAEVFPGQTVGTHRPDRKESDYPTATRNKRSVWTIATKPYSEAHFAVMAPELAETCIKAGTSEYGVCPHCGSPWARVTERKHSTSHDAESATLYDSKSTAGRLAKLRQAARAAGKEYSSSRTTTGWAAGCGCVDNEPVPATVLDPFGGAGTTCLVADQLQRNSVMIELNPEYAKLAERRITGDAPMFTEVSCA